MIGESDFLFERIDKAKFYQELLDLRIFTPEKCKKMVKCLDEIYSNDPTFFAGKKAKVIKAGITYACASVLGIELDDASGSSMAYRVFNCGGSPKRMYEPILELFRELIIQTLHGD